MKKIATERLIIRNFCASDVGGAHILFSDYEAMRLVGMLPAFEALAETEERCRRWAPHDERLAIVERETGEFVGYIAINEDSEEGRDDTRELGFGVAGPFRRNGYMKETIAAVLDDLRKEGIKYVWACAFKENVASANLIESLGFELIQEGTYDAANDREYESLEFRITLD